MNASKVTLVRVTGNEPEKDFLDSLGFTPDEDSRPELFEWYWTMPLEDALALSPLYYESNPSWSENSNKTNIKYSYL